jgi:hypothetical protein
LIHSLIDVAAGARRRPVQSTMLVAVVLLTVRMLHRG